VLPGQGIGQLPGIDDLTKAVLDTITLETALKSTRLRNKAAATGISGPLNTVT
jgi:hypothetical protein